MASLTTIYLALTSPLKGLIKVEEGEVGLPRNRIKSDQLPPSIRDKFPKVLPVIIAWMAASADPWRVNSNELIEALEIAGRTYAGDDYTLEDGKKSPEYKMVCVRSLEF